MRVRTPPAALRRPEAPGRRRAEVRVGVYRQTAGYPGDPAVLAGGGPVRQPDIAAAVASFSLVEHGGGLARRDRSPRCGSPASRGFTGYMSTVTA